MCQGGLPPTSTLAKSGTGPGNAKHARVTSAMAHVSLEELVAKFRAAREAGEGRMGHPEQVKRLRALTEDCPAFTPGLLYLAWALQLSDEAPQGDAEEDFAEIQRLLEQAVQSSNRSAPAVVELGYFLDTFYNSPEAEGLYEEGATRSLETLEDAWAGLLRFWKHERTKESLAKALPLAALAEKVFPESPRIRGHVEDVRRCAAMEGLLRLPEEP